MDDEIMEGAEQESFDGGWESEAFSDEDIAVDEVNTGAEGENADGEGSEGVPPAAGVEGFAEAKAPGIGAPPPAGMRPDFLSFVREHPEVSVSDIPREVWERVSAGESLSSAWMRHENESLRLRVMAMEQNERNGARSAGSRVSAGKERGSDPFDTGWDEV